tara:strand:- start:1224 stop:1508 length:285 start_codon:yes stop_codon:yes gene_type:complete
VLSLEQTIKKWQNKLEIQEWDITLESIHPEQIEYNGEKYFIGITRDFKNKTGVIYHDIDLYEEAIIHELLHVRYPTKSEDWVNKKTKKLFENGR